MGVYIKAMEMPTSCLRGGCPVDGASCHLWEEKYWQSSAEPYLKRHPKCPLVEIPPHGRLIDADAAAKRGWTISRTYSASPTEMVYEAKTMTDEVLPTIIEAEEEET